MEDHALEFDPRLIGLSVRDWANRLYEIAKEHGSVEQIDAYHAAFFLKAGPKLLVTFECAEDIRNSKIGAEPRGYVYAREEGWSCLSIIAFKESWFRDPSMYDHFDELIDDGFFDSFDDVLFYGNSAGGYAAAAYSVACPGARVLAIRPQATLDPRIASFDNRYKEFRRYDFTSRYGFAPAMIDAAQQAYIVYDPTQVLDAAHAALFARPNVELLHAKSMGHDIEKAFDGLGIHDDMLLAAMDGRLTTVFFARLMRARRAHDRYLRRLFRQAINSGHPQLAANLAYFVMRGREDTYFYKQLQALKQDGIKPQQARLAREVAGKT